MTSMSPKIFRSIGLMALFLASSVALSADAFPGYSPDRNLIKTQQKVDKLFEKGNYERAMLIYRDELAPLGDKFAQYMVGYMHYSGRGVPKDRVIACAWYWLAAERGDESFVKVRNALDGILDDEQRSRAGRLYKELHSEMGDIVLITGLIKQDLKFLRQRRGDSALFGGDLERGNYGHNLSKYQAAADRLEERVFYLDQIIDEDQSASDDELRKARSLVDNARREIDVFKASIN